MGKLDGKTAYITGTGRDGVASVPFWKQVPEKTPGRSITELAVIQRERERKSAPAISTR